MKEKKLIHQFSHLHTAIKVIRKYSYKFEKFKNIYINNPIILIALIVSVLMRKLKKLILVVEFDGGKRNPRTASKLSECAQIVGTHPHRLALRASTFQSSLSLSPRPQPPPPRG